MAYIKNNWVDREGTTRYFEAVDADGAKIFTPDYTQVTELGTPVNADNMNHIEEGIEAGSFTKFNLATTYAKDDLVTAIEDGSPVIYKSLLDNNIGNALSNSDAWEKISLGGGAGGLEIGDIGFTQMAIDETKGKRRLLNGSVIIQEQYVQFTNIVKNSVALNPDLACTESEWQTAVTMSTNGVCYKFVIDDEAGTIRLPKYPEYLDLSINGTKTVSVYGTGKSLGLTDGNTNAGFSHGGSAHFDVDTSFYNVTLPAASGSKNGYVTNYILGVSKDGTKSGLTGSVTTDSEQIKGTYFIQVATGAETEDNIINEIELNNPFSLLDYKYSEYALNNLSWLRSNGQYNAKAVYPAVYDLLLKIYNGTETKTGVNVKLHTEAYTDYDFVLNPAEETFRLPLLDGSEDKPNYDKPISITNSGFTADKRGLVVAYASITATWAYFAIAVNGVEMTSVGTGNFTQSSGRLQTFVEKGDVVTFIGSYTSLAAQFYPNQGNGSLYFYVGETVQNANLINAGRIEETLANKTDKSMVDGMWVATATVIDNVPKILAATSKGSFICDLSDYLPKDGYSYEIMMSLNFGNANTYIHFVSDAIPMSYTMQGPSTETRQCFYVVGANKQLTVNIDSTATPSATIRLSAYRRLGTNV